MITQVSPPPRPSLLSKRRHHVYATKCCRFFEVFCFFDRHFERGEDPGAEIEHAFQINAIQLIIIIESPIFIHETNPTHTNNYILYTFLTIARSSVVVEVLSTASMV